MSFNKDNQQPPSKSRQPLQSRAKIHASSLLLEDSRTPMLSKGNSTEIEAISLSFDSIDADNTLAAKIPVLEPTEIESSSISKHEEIREPSIQAASLKSSQLRHLEANEAVATEAREHAKVAAKILEEAKATQLAVNQNNTFLSRSSKQALVHMEEIEQGLRRSQKIVRESNFIHNEIKRIYTKIEKQANNTDLSEKSKEVDDLIDTLHQSRAILDKLHIKAQQSHEHADNRLEALQKELKACSSIRKRLENDEVKKKEFEQSQKKLHELIQRAMDLLDQSEENISMSKQGQTSYIAVSREIKALSSQLQSQKAQTNYLSDDIKNANKAIAQNATAVESLASDIKHVQNALESAQIALVNEEASESKQAFEQLLQDTLIAQKRVSQLLQLNNSVSDRITKIDTSISKKIEKQDEFDQHQAQAITDLQQQRLAIKRLIDQADRSHVLIVSACKKTSSLAEQVTALTAQEEAHKDAITAALNEGKTQTTELNELKQQLRAANEQHRSSLNEVEATQRSLSQAVQTTLSQHKQVEQALSAIKASTPELEKQKHTLTGMLENLEAGVHANQEKHRELQTLETTLSGLISNHQSTASTLEKQLTTQLERHNESLKTTESQQTRLSALESDLTAKLNDVNNLSTNIQEQVHSLSEQKNAVIAANKDLDFTQTELRYLKEQCDSLLKDCMEYNDVIKKSETTSKKSIKKLEQLEKSVSKSLENHKIQEQTLEQLNDSITNALNDLNIKLDQFEAIETRAKEQQEKNQAINADLEKQQTAQTKVNKKLNTTMKTVENHIKNAKEREQNLNNLEQTLTKQSEKRDATIEAQNKRLQEQQHIIEAQLTLLDDVEKNYDETQKSLQTIDQIRKKAQQSFAHLGAQKTKFEQAFEEAGKKIKHQEQKQAEQQALIGQTKLTMKELLDSVEKVQAFSKEQDEKTQVLDEKLEKIDEYQSRAYQVQKSANAREQQLQQRHEELKDTITHFQNMMEKLDATRLEEAQFRDELRALVHSQERQQKEMSSQLAQTKDQHELLSQSLDDAHLMFRENKLATKETQMANRETKLILQEIQREISQLKDSGTSASQIRKLAAQERIDSLAEKLHEEQDLTERSASEDTVSESKKAPPYTPSSFML